MNDSMLNKALALRHELHMYPELSMEEAGTIGRIKGFLEENTKLELHDEGSYFYAVYRAQKALRAPVAFRADIDALPIMDGIEASYRSRTPGVGHKCGHDGHTATLALLAMETEARGADRDVYFLFQPGEETGFGAKECVPMIEKNDIHEIYAWHNMPFVPRGEVSLRVGAMQCASTGMILSFRGKTSHASHPEDGINPAFAIAETVLALKGLTGDSRFTGMTMTTVIEVKVGEHAFGTNAGAGELLLTVRAEKEAELQMLTSAICDYARARADEHGLGINVSYEDTFPETANTKDAAGKVVRASERAGVVCRELPEAERASEDFGHLIKAAGNGAIFFIGSEGCTPLHTVGFDFPDELMPEAVKIMLEIMKD